MKISDLKEHLDAMEGIYGDIEVVVWDVDTGWLLRITDSDLDIVGGSMGVHLEISPTHENRVDSSEINKEVKR